MLEQIKVCIHSAYLYTRNSSGNAVSDILVVRPVWNHGLLQTTKGTHLNIQTGKWLERQCKKAFNKNLLDLVFHLVYVRKLKLCIVFFRNLIESDYQLDIVVVRYSRFSSSLGSLTKMFTPRQWYQPNYELLL